MEFHSKCTLCPRNCDIDRTIGLGVCQVGNTVKLARAALHYWEEPCISGENGSGGMGGFFFGMRVRYKYLMVTDAETGDNVVGKVFINGPMEFSSVKEGDEVIAEKVPYENHHRFYYVTAMYTKR